MVRLTDEEIIELFTVRLPDLLERRPELEPAIYSAFLKFLARKEEVAAVLAELREFRVETRLRFEQVDKHLEQVDKHLEQVDKRLEQVDKRFEQVDKRFEQVDQRFEQVDKRFEQVDKRFEQVDKRFEQVDQRFEQVDRRFEQLEQRLEAGIQELHRAIDRLGARWGIRNESIFRQTIAALLEQSFGVRVEQRWIGNEQFDVLIYDGQHILVEIAASVGPKIQERLERKRALYIQHTGITPARIILATASIHSQRAQALRQMGIEVIEPEEETLTEE
ncbi:MAG: DUF3782 domain-containing protein [Anaerolineae bacterium]|nr:DUF3782 domain-containing protein [Anaerolineae bacterium]